MTVALLLLGLAAHVKLTALIFMPVALVWLWRRAGLWRASAAALLAGALLTPLSWALYRPLGGWATLANNLYERSQLSANSIGELLYLYRRFGLGMERYQAQIPMSQALTLAFALLAGALLLIWLLRRGAADLKALSALAGGVILLYLLIGSYWFQPWYALWGLALSALWPASLLARRVMPALATAALCAAAGADFLRHTAPMPLAGWQISALFVLVVWLAVTSTATPAWRAHCRDQRTA